MAVFDLTGDLFAAGQQPREHCAATRADAVGSPNVHPSEGRLRMCLSAHVRDLQTSFFAARLTRAGMPLLLALLWISFTLAG